MANIVFNEVTITHKSENKLIKLFKAANKELLDSAVPMPTQLSGHDAYLWRLAFWGVGAEVDPMDTKAHLELANYNYGGKNTLSLMFQTPNAAPKEWFTTLNRMGFEVEAYFYEEYYDFCGCYTDGKFEQYQILGGTDWVRQNIPAHVVDELDLIDMMALDEE